MAEHTPGPRLVRWATSASSERIASRPGIVFGGLGEETNANARLIAAAPDLLAALRDVEAYFKKQLSYYESANEPGFRRQYDLWNNALAAIAKAEGRTA